MPVASEVWVVLRHHHEMKSTWRNRSVTPWTDVGLAGGVWLYRTDNRVVEQHDSQPQSPNDAGQGGADRHHDHRDVERCPGTRPKRVESHADSVERSIAKTDTTSPSVLLRPVSVFV